MSRRSSRDNPEPSREVGSAPWKREGDGVGSFGGWLRKQREIRNLTLREIADSTKIGMRYLEALETDRFDRLPAPIFAKGFLRQYAKYVGLDPDEVVNFYLQASRKGTEEEEEEEEETASAPRPLPRPTRHFLILLGIVILVLVLVGALVYFRDDVVEGRNEEASPPPMAAPVSVSPAEIPPEPSEVADTEPDRIQVTLAFTGECWVEVTVDGERRLSELRVQGESVQLEADRQVELTLGDPSNVRIEVNGRPFGLDVPAGRVVRDVVIDRRDAGLGPLPPEPETTGAS